MKSKRGNVVLGMFILSSFIISIVIFSLLSYLLYVAGHDYIVIPTYNISLSLNESANIEAGFDSVMTNYQDIDLSIIDDMAFVSWIIVTSVFFYLCYIGRETGVLSMMGIITYGSMFFLFVAGLFLVVTRWLYYDVLMNLFQNLIISTPKLEWLIDNFPIILLITLVIGVVINNVDLDISTMRQRKKKEQEALEEEIV